MSRDKAVLLFPAGLLREICTADYRGGNTFSLTKSNACQLEATTGKFPLRKPTNGHAIAFIERGPGLMGLQGPFYLPYG